LSSHATASPSIVHDGSRVGASMISGKTFGQIVARAAIERDPLVILAGDDPEAIVLDLIEARELPTAGVGPIHFIRLPLRPFS
jgi:hypothetical protein